MTTNIHPEVPAASAGASRIRVFLRGFGPGLLWAGTAIGVSHLVQSTRAGADATFALAGVIPCWTEGLQQISVGGKSRLVCPPDLAYGPQRPPGIPGNSALVFEVELLDILQ